MLAVVSGVLVLPGQLAASAAEADSTPLTEAQQALAEAEKSGQRVEVTGERTDRTTTFANPDGFTLTLEQSVVPVRVSKPGGGWQKPDATLEKRSDGSVGPKAAAVSIAFSAGGEKEPLARIAGEGTSGTAVAGQASRAAAGRGQGRLRRRPAGRRPAGDCDPGELPAGVRRQDAGGGGE
ncbi:hypothetical protein ACN6LD_002502 [Streptomyces sp. SAS_272]